MHCSVPARRTSPLLRSRSRSIIRKHSEEKHIGILLLSISTIFIICQSFKVRERERTRMSFFPVNCYIEYLLQRWVLRLRVGCIACPHSFLHIFDPISAFSQRNCSYSRRAALSTFNIECVHRGTSTFFTHPTDHQPDCSQHARLLAHSWKRKNNAVRFLGDLTVVENNRTQ